MPDIASAHTPEPTAVSIDLADRRGPERLPCPGLPQVRYLLRPSMQQGRALLRDLSAEGVGLLLPLPPELGASLFLQFPGPGRGTTHTRLARVVHASPRPSGTWLVGCRLTPPLAGQEVDRLRQLLAAARG